MISAALLVVAAASVEAQTLRAVALTFDDLPAVTTRHDSATYATITNGILGTLARERAPALGLVVGSLLFTEGRRDSMRVDMLRQWLRAGIELGNHTYSHRSLNQTPVGPYLRDIARGDSVLRELLAEQGARPRWFRHPMLHTGQQLETKRQVDSVLTRLGYRIAPVTIDNNDYIFARAYDNALDRRNRDATARVERAYLEYMDTVFGYYERQSQSILGYELPQTLLLHANRLNAACLDELFVMMRRRGYRFVTIDQAFADPAYRRPDEFLGNAGITWLHRWALADGKRGEFFAGEPQVPAFIQQMADSR